MTNTQHAAAKKAGVSGMSVYVPALRVNLEDWCGWTEQNWSKIQAIVGKSYRLPAPDEDAYTMAASAVLRLIRNYDIDPRRVGYLGLGTESSTDNAAGAVIVRGMVDRALDDLGLPRLSRNCEVHEIKHACLGGIYALKGAVRYLNTDGRDRQAIVVSTDIAEYERGSSGEQTQGAGAVAMLCEPEAKLFELDLDNAGSSSDYRGPDFRKPHIRRILGKSGNSAKRARDFPLFNGKYSTYAYIDETLSSFEDMVGKLQTSHLDALSRADTLFFHRPYNHMPVQAATYLLLEAWLHDAASSARVTELCQAADTNPGALLSELSTRPNLFARVLSGEANTDPLAASGKVASLLRQSEEFKAFVASKMSMGAAYTAHFGNMYCAALPGWMAAGVYDAAKRGVALGGTQALLIGYGSGDAAECIPARIAEGFAEHALRIRLEEAMDGGFNLSKAQYEGLHDSHEAEGLAASPGDRFRIAYAGERDEAAFQDLGMDYYEYVR